MKQLVVISGKGGTGKTSLVASFAALADASVLADCDVDAADLPVLFPPTILQRHEFSGGSQARILPEKCTGCATCLNICRFGAVSREGPANATLAETFRIDPMACEGCGVCAQFCPAEAIEFTPVINGEWCVSDARHGPMVHAKLGPGQDNSGKLVGAVRAGARQVAIDRGIDLVLIDGPPGIGCPVIASLTGADLVLIVTEPSVSGEHDLRRVGKLTAHFRIPTLLCVNKWDLNQPLTHQIESDAKAAGIQPIGRIRYDRAVTEAQTRGLSIVEHTSPGIVDDVGRIWQCVSDQLAALPKEAGEVAPA
jgi:MinD superfamily P-loop ATPase